MQGEERYGKIIAILLEAGLITEKQAEHARKVREKTATRPPLLHVVQELTGISSEQVQGALRQNANHIRIGDFLIELGLISEADLKEALRLQKEEKQSRGRSRKLGEVLIDSGIVAERHFLNALSMQMGVQVIEPEFADIDESLVRSLNISVLERNDLIPVRLEKDGSALVAFADPFDMDMQEFARDALGREIRLAISSKRSVHEALKKVQARKREKAQEDSHTDIPALLDSILADAVQMDNVSDIHFECLVDRIRIRLRMDGVLTFYRDLPLKIAPALISRIKVLAEADIAEKRRHQGGRFLYELNSQEMDIRVSIYVTIHGESAVLRLLSRQASLLGINDLGMAPNALKKFRYDALDSPGGVVIFTGPTGSGKTTTAYSAINYLNTPDTKIITAEEPVEYVIDEVSQCSIDPSINLTFDETLRHIVRQDPDVIFVGEIRDSHSADVSVQAALTGHKVLTTFHTEDSIGGLIRLLNMDIDAFLISSTVVSVVAQRLLRRVCPYCCVRYEPTPTDYYRMGYSPEDLEGIEFVTGRGCGYCRYTGYRGRLGVFEVLCLNEEIRDGLLERKTSHQIRQISVESTGLVSLYEDGIVKAAQGQTTIEEVLRVLPRLQKPRPIEDLFSALGARQGASE